MAKKDYRFEFVLQDVTQEQAEHLMDIVVSYAESHGTVVGGGCGPVDEAEEEGDGEAQ